jgi:hypothetical protein
MHPHRSTSSLSIMSASALSFILAIGCGAGESDDDNVVHRSAVTQANYRYYTRLTVPMYTDDEVQWSKFFNNFASHDHSESVVIVNGSNSGPDDPATATQPVLEQIARLHSRITQLKNYGVLVIG